MVYNSRLSLPELFVCDLPGTEPTRLECTRMVKQNMFTASMMSVDQSPPSLSVSIFLLFLAVGYSLRFEDAIPKAVGNLDVVFDGSRVLQLGFLCHADEPFDVVPIPTEQRAVIGNGIIGGVRSGHTADDGILAALVLLVFHAFLKVSPGRMKIEEFNLLDVSLLHHLPPVGVEKVRDVAVFVRFGEATITRFLPQQPDDLRAVCVEDDDRDAKREVFEVLAHPEEVRSRKALKIIKCIDSGCFFVL